MSGLHVWSESAGAAGQNEQRLTTVSTPTTTGGAAVGAGYAARYAWRIPMEESLRTVQTVVVLFGYLLLTGGCDDRAPTPQNTRPNPGSAPTDGDTPRGTLQVKDAPEDGQSTGEFAARWRAADRETRRQLIAQGDLATYLTGKDETQVIALLGQPDGRVTWIPGVMWTYFFDAKTLLTLTFDAEGRYTGCEFGEVWLKGGPDQPPTQ